VNVGENQILIETYNLQFDFENLNIDEDDHTVDCEAIFDYSKDSSITSRKSVQNDLNDLICTIQDLSKSVTFTDSANDERTVKDLRTRITVSLLSNRLLKYFESGDLKFQLDRDAFTQDCNGHDDLEYIIEPDGGVTDYNGPAGCLCEESSSTCNVCSPFTDLKNGKCQCGFEYDFEIDADGNNATLHIQNVILSE